MIVVDIDGVIADSDKWLIKEIEERSGKRVVHKNPREFTYGVDIPSADLLLWIDYALIKYQYEIEPFDYIRTFIGLTMLEKAEGVVNFLSARSSGAVEKATRYWIDKYFEGLNYNLHLIGDGNSKYKWMHDRGFNTIIEDRLKTANEIFFETGATYLVNQDWNNNRSTKEHVFRVDSFYDAVENYLKL